MLLKLEKLVSTENLQAWAATIRVKFDADNAHLLLSRPSSDDTISAVVR